MVKHVQIVSILMLIQGGLEGIIGLLLTFMGPFMASQQSRRPGPSFPTEVAGIFVLIGIAVLVAAALKIIGGVNNLKFRGRTLGIAALFSGLLTVLTCYCAPTSIGLMIYGLIVYFNKEVVQAFEMGEQGLSPQISVSFQQPQPYAPFSPIPPYQTPDPYQEGKVGQPEEQATVNDSTKIEESLQPDEQNNERRNDGSA